MNLHVHSAHRQRKSLGCEHKKRVEKRWRITRADICPGVYGPLDHIVSSVGLVLGSVALSSFWKCLTCLCVNAVVLELLEEFGL